ncbi:hypothetical protein CK505_15920 [Kocuria sp. WN036]|uniref:DUF3500 domain-containing protein n=1 Tax=Kocuria TaxID=57493 RepID=UPI000BAB4B97|nr:DUF3500 domain-containing protein [Kocuria sp. WN036]MCM3486947.1 DUF3500 domain-containing protein [Kocuria rosea]PAU86855.1 hypothetical protein CK505_15920 [Kocuria sp. WN036]
MTTATHRFRKTAAAFSLIGVLSISACAPAATDATTTTTASTTSSTSTRNTSPGTTVETITDTTAAAQNFLATLSEEQREQILYAYDDETRTTSWSNFPATFVQRAGLNLADLTEEQQTAALAVLEGLLSEEGYRSVTGIMGGDQFLLENSNSTDDSLGQYYIAFFGDPSDTSAWEVQFGGHHLGINATLDGTEGSVTFAPTHLGSQPAVYTDADGNEVEPVAGMYETAFAFYDSLSEKQQAQLYQGEQVSNLVCAPGDTCDYPTGTGIAGSELTEEQQQLLLDVIANWVGLADEQTTAAALEQIKASLDETYVNWSGSTVYDMAAGEGIYFQISGPDVYIEFSNQQGSAGADVAGYTTGGWGHIHTIYRDPSSDYAGAVTQQEATGMGGPGGAAPAGEPAGTPPANG